MATTPPAAYVFDAYGTLFDVHSVARACEACWPGRGAALSQLWRSKQLEYTWLRSLMGRYAPFSAVTRDALQWSCESLGLPVGNELDGLMAQYLQLKTYDDVEATLGRLDGKKAILSNGSPDMLDPLVRSSRLQFDAVLSVDPLKVYKPAPQVYQLAIQKLGVKKEQIAFVSSNCWDAIGAKAFGLRVYWINRARAPVDRLDFAPDQVLTTLSDLK